MSSDKPDAKRIGTMVVCGDLEEFPLVEFVLEDEAYARRIIEDHELRERVEKLARELETAAEEGEYHGIFNCEHLARRLRELLTPSDSTPGSGNRPPAPVAGKGEERSG
ncbi:MAG: hypothetical protein IVW52_05125 [Acidimicrobiales bacterium]|nr:hypothetical protein [Acidimicrobiales bacterium]